MATLKNPTKSKSLKIIGNNALISIAGVQGVPAKIDTGATLSAVWASDIRITPNHQLEFSLFGPSSPLYTGERLTIKSFSAQRVRSSIGAEEVRYRIKLPIVIHGRRIRATFTLADRSANKFPVLIGRRTLLGKFLVDVSRSSTIHPGPLESSALNRRLQADPQDFHRQYIDKHSK